MTFTRAQRRWIKAAFTDAVEIYVVHIERDVPKMYRTFAAMLSRRQRAGWRRPMPKVKKSKSMADKLYPKKKGKGKRKGSRY